MAKEVEFNSVELKVFAFLADDKGHALWEMCDKLNIDEGRLSKILKGLKSKGLIFNKERSLDRPAGERGPKIEYPWYIQKDKFLDIGDTIASQIRYYTLKISLSSNEKERFDYGQKAYQTLELFKEILKFLSIDSHSYKSLCALIDNVDFGATERQIIYPEPGKIYHLTDFGMMPLENGIQFIRVPSLEKEEPK